LNQPGFWRWFSRRYSTSRGQSGQSRGGSDEVVGKAGESFGGGQARTPSLV
jgi:hypothetical protein